MSTKKKTIIIIGLCLVLAAILIPVGIHIVRNWNEPKPADIEPIYTKVGKYYLQRESGPDRTDYIEIYDDGTIQFFGEYWEKRDAETAAEIAAMQANPSDPLNILYTDRQVYSYTIVHDAIGIGVTEEEQSECGMFLCAGLVDENTISLTRTRKDDDVIDYNEKYQDGSVNAHYVYGE